MCLASQTNDVSRASVSRVPVLSFPGNQQTPKSLARLKRRQRKSKTFTPATQMRSKPSVRPATPVQASLEESKLAPSAHSGTSHGQGSSAHSLQVAEDPCQSELPLSSQSVTSYIRDMAPALTYQRSNSISHRLIKAQSQNDLASAYHSNRHAGAPSYLRVNLSEKRSLTPRYRQQIHRLRRR